jgi:hypothetical protein
MAKYEEGEVYTCTDPDCQVEITITKGCTGEKCPTGPLICCDKPMVKKR